MNLMECRRGGPYSSVEFVPEGDNDSGGYELSGRTRSFNNDGVVAELLDGDRHEL